MKHKTVPASAAVHPSGWARLPSGREVTRLPLIDASTVGRPVTAVPPMLFARLTYGDALEVAAREGARLISPEALLELGNVGLQLRPYTGTPTAETDIVHSERHDADVWRQLKAADWDGLKPVSGAGKHWVSGAPEGRSRLMGWDKDGDGPGKALWQPLAVAHNRFHHDDGTTTMLERDGCAAIKSPQNDSSLIVDRDTDPGPPPIVEAPLQRDPLPLLPFRQAKHYHAGRKEGRPLWVIIHTAEMAERVGGALGLQGYAATMPDGRQASWHYSVDSEWIAPCVREEHTAWAAPGANARGIQVELCGFARQTAAEWSDDYSRRQLAIAARLVRECCDRWQIPVVKVSALEMMAGRPGIAGHSDVSAGVGKGKTNHTDPGKAFPWFAFLEMVRQG